MRKQIKAALGKVKITPEDRAPLQGYNPEKFIADPATDVLDDLYARVLLWDDGAERKVWVSVDCCLTNENTGLVADPGGRQGQYREFIPSFPPGTRQAWAAAAGTDENGISVHATHTHTAPAHYNETYCARIGSLIRDLADQLQPVTVSVAEGRSGISAFRRPTLHADRSVPVNQTLRVLVLESENGRAVGAVVCYPVHPTAVRNPVSRLSGDIVGLAVSRVEEQLGTGAVAMFLQGFSGDICPLYGDNGPTQDTYPDVVKGSQVLSQDIMEAIARREDVQVSAFRSLFRKVELPTREHFYKPALEVGLFGFSLGDTVLLAVSGEVFNGFMAKVEQISPFRHTFLSGLANGYSGYIPTHQAFHDGLGGYEMNTTPFTDQAEQLLLSEVSSLLQALHQPS